LPPPTPGQPAIRMPRSRRPSGGRDGSIGPFARRGTDGPRLSREFSSRNSRAGPFGPAIANTTSVPGARRPGRRDGCEGAFERGSPAMSKPTAGAGWQRAILTLTGTVVGVVVIGTLYWAQAVFIPVALAGFLTFLLSPLVTRLRHLGLPRTPSVIVAVVFSA